MYKSLTDTRATTIKIMKYFQIPPRKVFIGQIAGELEYEVWANDKDDLFIGKIRDLPKEPEDPKFFTLKPWVGLNDSMNDDNLPL